MHTVKTVTTHETHNIRTETMDRDNDVDTIRLRIGIADGTFILSPVVGVDVCLGLPVQEWTLTLDCDQNSNRPGPPCARSLRGDWVLLGLLLPFVHTVFSQPYPYCPGWVQLDLHRAKEAQPEAE